MRCVLEPLSWIYGFVMSVRNRLYDLGVLSSYTSTIPVISIGNLTAGGNGKTPLCMFLVRELKQRGYRPVVLSRGYGGSENGPRFISKDDTSRSVGDEPLLMLHHGIDVVVARRRVAGAQLIERAGGYDVIVLDDGLQHRALGRKLNLATVFVGSDSAITAFTKGRLLPYGLFREDRQRAMRRLDAVVLSHRAVLQGSDSPEVDERLRAALPVDMPVYTSALKDGGVRWLSDKSHLSPCQVALFTAIANPSGVVDSLETLGFSVKESRVFADHHYFSEQELRDFIACAGDIPIVCTEKDAVKLTDFPVDLISKVAVISVSAYVFPGDEFIEQVIGALLAKSSSP